MVLRFSVFVNVKNDNLCAERFDSVLSCFLI